MKKFSSKLGSQIVKTANGYSFKISKEEWTQIGKKAQWLPEKLDKKAFGEQKGWYTADTDSGPLEVEFSFSGSGEDLDISFNTAKLLEPREGENPEISGQSVLNDILRDKRKSASLYENVQETIRQEMESAEERSGIRGRTPEEDRFNL